MEDPGQIDAHTLDRYLRERVLPALGSGGDYALEPVKTGSRNLVWFLTTAEGGSFVLKAVSKRFRIKNLIRAHRYLRGRGLPVPRLLFADRARATAGQTGYYFACEERVRGMALDELGAERTGCLGPVAALFAGMHQTTSLRWGKLKTFQVLGFRQYLLRKAGERLHALADAGCALPGPSPQAILAWFERASSGLGMLQSFNLCHGDVNMQNILVGPGREIRLIDMEAFKFLPFQIEFFRLAYALCGFDAALHERFRKLYAAGSSKKNLRRFQAGGPLYHAYVLLEIAWYGNKKLKDPALSEAGRQPLHDIRAAALERLAGMLGS
jgi:Ser/Thr protein kinase RdoA (MazF antagonist)